MLATPTDMLVKARRELRHLRADVTADSVFNFFVTAFHVKDYLRGSSPASASAIDALYADPDLRACEAICNQGKHLKVSRKAGPVGQKLSGRSGMMGVGKVGAMMIGAGEEWDLTYDAVSLNPVELAERVLGKLEAHFGANGIPTS